MCKKFLNWWNNLPFCKKKKEKWLKARNNNNDGLLKTISWPENVFKTKKDDFVESDWTYKAGDRCERYVAWFFKWITKRCTVLERQLDFVPMDTPTGIGGWHPNGYVTSYKVKDDGGDEHNYVRQSDLSF